MKFKLLINPHKNEIIEAQVHQKSIFTDNLEKFVLTNGNSNSITAYDDKDHVILQLEDIVMITILDNKITAICINNKRYHLRKRIYQLTNELPNNFWRINKSSIVNKIYIDRFEETKTAGVNIVMKNGLSDYVSRRCFSKIRKELK
ncbi:LytTR family DNA-binding domain-containing protein [Lactobacillus crispatus]|jgi:DNA-binding LytR/AlgR family response regulator|uniref:LytTR family DNA-binding domain-containing protein n=1 Tax=Lactobacillus crispatus TaxID=47770 RepID=UPI0018ABD13C|nr:LytTR family DNA-binding domain-containing protein [Lactobacillus crispatus]MCH4004876.1 LytTR family transcriptional regulator [Lactobacillus crispatus]MCI1335635.1 LytTR family transcriptional regulator [Lactobacillus crispatus]MCI1364829.1 LytTR family transcriptional regulator [Lactobacillus crispatus]MCI1493029.1 LytTR family transcriptional regulator [Lactobacillus crispatus]MCI1525357.1 LytTR family transcriptional regulator [Lactobacillus crispatus]